MRLLTALLRTRPGRVAAAGLGVGALALTAGLSAAAPAMAAPAHPAAVTISASAAQADVAHAKAAHHAPLAGTPICLVSGSQFCLDGQGQGNQMILNYPAISTFSTSDCGEQSGQKVEAFENSNGLWVHALSNGNVTLDNNSTNGCSNPADKWLHVSGTSTQWLNFDYNRLLYSPTENAGAEIQNSDANGWITWMRAT